MWTYYARDPRVVDGDTVDLTIDLGFDVSIRQRVRANCLDAPELRGDQLVRGRAASARLTELLDGAEQIRVQTSIDPRSRRNREKYGRYLADLWILPRDGPDWVGVWDILRREGHVK